MPKTESVNFYTEPAFWAFLTASVSSIFGLIRMAFVYYGRSQERGAKLSMSVERFKADNVQKSLDYLNGVVARIEPLVTKHEDAVKALDETTKMVAMVEKNLTAMFRSLQSQYEGFEGRITNITASYQLLVDRVDALNKDFKIKLGTVTRRP